MTALQARDRQETDRRYVGVADGGNSSSAGVHWQRSPAQRSLDVNVNNSTRSRAHLWLSVWTKEVKGGQSRRTGAARQLVNAADNQMDGPICQGATVASCLATLPHLDMPQKEVGIYCNHVNSLFEYSLDEQICNSMFSTLKSLCKASAVLLLTWSYRSICAHRAQLAQAGTFICHCYASRSKSDPRVNINMAFLGRQLHY